MQVELGEFADHGISFDSLGAVKVRNRRATLRGQRLIRDRGHRVIVISALAVVAGSRLRTFWDDKWW